MSVFETIGLTWVVFTSALGHVILFYCAWVGARKMVVFVDAKVEEDTNIPASWSPSYALDTPPPRRGAPAPEERVQDGKGRILA